MDNKDLEIARLQDELELEKRKNNDYLLSIQEMQRKLSDVSDAIYDVYRSI